MDCHRPACLREVYCKETVTKDHDMVLKERLRVVERTGRGEGWYVSDYIKGEHTL